MFGVHAIDRKAGKARLSRPASVLVIGALSASSWAMLIFAGFKLWQLL